MTAIASPAAALSKTQEGENTQPFLHIRGGIYYFKGTYPKDVRIKVPGESAQKWKSLGTRDADTAQTKLAVEIQVFKSDLEKMRAANLPGPKRALEVQPHASVASPRYFEGQTPQLVKCLEYDLMKADDDFRRKASDSELVSMREQREKQLAALKDANYRLNFGVVAAELNDMLRRERMTLPPNTELRRRVEEAFSRKKVEVLEVLINRRDNGAKTPEAPIRLREMVTLLDLHTEWAGSATKKGKGGLPRRRTINMYRGCVDEFAKMFGAVPVAAITRGMCEAYLETLIEAELSRRTIENRIYALRALVQRRLDKLLKANGSNKKNINKNAPVVPKPFDNVFAQLDLDGIPRTAGQGARRPYEIGELAKLFSSEVFTNNFRPKGQVGESAYWAPLIGLFAGLRIEEIAQLDVTDIACRNGVWIFRVCEFGDKKLKNIESRRDVPIHEELLRLGVLAHAAKMKLDGHERLFPTLENHNKNELYSNALTKWYSRYLDRIELDDPRLCFHSLRRNFALAATDGDVQTETKYALMGHWFSEGNKNSNGYLAGHDKKYPIGTLVKGMEKVRFPGLDLSALYKTETQRFRGVEEAFGIAPPKIL